MMKYTIHSTWVYRNFSSHDRNINANLTCFSLRRFSFHQYLARRSRTTLCCITPYTTVRYPTVPTATLRDPSNANPSSDRTRSLSQICGNGSIPSGIISSGENTNLISIYVTLLMISWVTLLCHYYLKIC